MPLGGLHSTMQPECGAPRPSTSTSLCLREAKAASKAGSDTETLRLGLEALVREGAYARLRALRGAEPRAADVPRRREPAASRSSKHSSA